MNRMSEFHRQWVTYFSKLVVAITAVVLLTGCVDYDEEMWLNADLSGRASIMISAPEELVRKTTGFEKDISEDSVRQELEKVPGVKLETFESFREAGKLVAKFKITFDDIEKLTRQERGVSGSTAVSFLGEITVHEEGRKRILQRHLQTLPQVKGGTLAKDVFAKSLSSLLFSKNHLVYKLHLPGEIISANSQRIDGSSRTVDWNYTLAQALREAPSLQVEWKNGIELNSMLVIGALLTFVILVVAALIRRSSHRSRKSEQ